MRLISFCFSVSPASVSFFGYLDRLVITFLSSSSSFPLLLVSTFPKDKMADIATKSVNLGNRTYICQNTQRAAQGVIWYSGNPLKVPYSLFMIEFSVFSSVSLLFEFLLKPLGQSKLVSHLLVCFLFQI